ncbi:MAG: DUF4369 domain-containing protein [Clostridia bacterium]|nr:DUF4369 domain-containing protein [Clostridia bacterium]
MKTQQKLLALLMLVITVFTACNKAPEPPFSLNGTVEGIKDGKAQLMIFGSEGLKRDTADIKDGKFIFTGNYPDPMQAQIAIIEGDKYLYAGLYLENTKMTFKGDINNPQKYEIKGGKVQEDANILQAKKEKVAEAFDKEYGFKAMREKLFATGKNPDSDLLDKYLDLSNKLQAKHVELETKFVDENPASPYSLILVSGMARGKGPKAIEELLSKLDPKFKDSKSFKDLRAKVEQLKTTDIGIENIIEAENVNYKLGNRFDKKIHKGIAYLGVFKNDNICALKQDGSVQILASNGKSVRSFKAELSGKPSALAVGDDDKVYILAGLTEVVKTKYRGREVERRNPVGVECVVYSAKGKKLNSFKLKDIITATGARIVDENLIIADVRQAKIAIFNKANGAYKSTIKGMRPCCGILDFSVNDKNEVLVANLGAFRVQSYDFTGKQIVAFGQRGKAIDEFQGCCNPVSVAYLSNGAIVTVEKDPTRVKIYSKDGAKQIAGIEELVKGCSYIPMIVDSKDNLFLASPEKGMVKCISMN